MLLLFTVLQLPMTRTEETALLEEVSSGSDHGEGSGEEEERNGRGKWKEKEVS